MLTDRAEDIAKETKLEALQRRDKLTDQTQGIAFK